MNSRYHPWSFLRSPGWVQIKCELRTLASFAFNLNIDWELTGEHKTVVDGYVSQKKFQVRYWFYCLHLALYSRYFTY
ncbi:unnamed protein product [Porites evermanni]|uniref:RUN domain-containing protein n=1 Tax=Porites evermanni TaxID=104178 RepID=A0ABN8N790_9CNID|nr:unnamed protein product [Porites evermanni]